jgi:hypothetical protein
LPHVSSGGLGLFAVEGAEWVYPGVGFVHPTAPCQCWNARFALDTFGRTFAPESVRHQVAVLDSNGNLMMRIGRYGNVDEGKPLIPDQRFRSREPRALGGDEVAMSYANYVATHTDHRLFIYDAASDRVLSVKLDYHAKETIPLKEKPE